MNVINIQLIKLTMIESDVQQKEKYQCSMKRSIPVLQ